jgi:glycerol kinase
LTLATTPLDILQAGLEAVAYRIALVFELLRPVLCAEPQVLASGGALLHSPTWLKIITDVLGQPVSVSQVQEASGRGAALLALEELGALSNLEEAPDFVSAASLARPSPSRFGRRWEPPLRENPLSHPVPASREERENHYLDKSPAAIRPHSDIGGCIPDSIQILRELEILQKR